MVGFNVKYVYVYVSGKCNVCCLLSIVEPVVDKRANDLLLVYNESSGQATMPATEEPLEPLALLWKSEFRTLLVVKARMKLSWLVSYLLQTN
jgi:hypothetical protein